MRVGILGAGNMATGLGRYFVKAGHRLIISHSRDPAKLERAAKYLSSSTQPGSAEEAARFGEVMAPALTERELDEAARELVERIVAVARPEDLQIVRVV